MIIFGCLAAVDHDEVVAQAFEADTEGVAEPAAERHEEKNGESAPCDSEGDQGGFLFPLAKLPREEVEKLGSHSLFPQGLDGIRGCGSPRRHHAGNNPDEEKNQDCGHADRGVNLRDSNIFLDFFNRDDFQDQGGEKESETASDQNDSQGLGKELPEDVPPLCAHGELDADFFGAFLDHHQHDGSHSHASDQQGEGADQSKKNIESHEENREGFLKLGPVPDE